MITGRTRVVAIVADPVARARSPMLLNALFAERHLDLVMVPFHVPAGGLEPVIEGMRAIENCAGALVSMPHKTRVTSLVDEVTRAGREVGACNVVRRQPDGRLVGTMFDGEGFVGGLTAAGHDVRGRRALVAGAGGAASAIAFALAHHGVAALTLTNRTAAKAEALAARVREAAPGVAVQAGDADPRGHDLVVNGTSLGMQPDDPPPVATGALEPGTIAAEVIVAHETTRFLDEAERRGCVVHRGEAMLVAQLDLIVDFLLPR
jgi:shikimate dehydrogenase